MLYTLKEAGQIVELSPNTLRKYINLKILKATKRGRDWYLTTQTMNALMKRHSDKLERRMNA